MRVTGETRDGRQRTPINLMLNNIWKIYFVAEGVAPNDALYQHAAQEKNVALWETYLRKTNNHRSNEANTLMREALLTCANAELERFLKGHYTAVERAREKAERANSVREDETSRQVLDRLRKEKQRVDGARNQADALMRASQWDAALKAVEPIESYLESWPELKQMREHALRQSHETHLFEGEKALSAKQLAAARSHCETAWQRLPASGKARECVCESRKLIALGKSQTARQSRRPKEAKEALEQQLGDRDCGSDARLTAELGKAKCEYAQQLLAEARQLIGVTTFAPAPAPPRPGAPRGKAKAPVVKAAAPAAPPVNVKLLTAQNKNDFRSARAKLLEAEQLCSEGPIQTLLAAANRSLAGYCLTAAQQAQQRGAAGTAYVYLQAAQGYTPNDTTVQQALQQAQMQLDALTRVGVGVVFANRSGNGQAGMLLNDLAAQLEASSQQAGLSNPMVLDRQQAAAALQAIQTGRQLPTPAVIFFGDLLAAQIRAANTPRRVQAYFLVDNPQYQQADAVYAEAKAQHEACRKQYGDANCGQYQARREQTDANRRRYEKHLKQPYEYYEHDIRVDGQLRLAFRATDSVARSTGAAETLGDSISKQCVQREGVRNDDANRTFLGPSVQNTRCDLADEQTYLSQMLNTVGREASSRALSQLRQLPLSYYSRAQSAANRQQAVEDYLRFLFLSSSKSSSEAQAAKQALLAYDAELQTDGVLR